MFQLRLLHARIGWIDGHVAWCLGRVICTKQPSTHLYYRQQGQSIPDHLQVDIMADYQYGQHLWLRICPSFSRANSLLGDMGIMLAPPVEGLQHH